MGLNRINLLQLPLFGLLLLGNGCSDSPITSSDSSNPTPMYVQPAPKGEVLKSGDVFPTLKAEGWLNGQPPAKYGPKVRLVVVDIWARWCPYCRTSAPELVRIYRKYSEKGVAFVSLTSMDRDSVEAFVKEFSVAWPNGYGAPSETLTALGVNSGMLMADYQIAPTLYLVKPEGKVQWCDAQGRFRHTAPQDWGQQLDEAIQAALDQKSAE